METTSNRAWSLISGAFICLFLLGSPAAGSVIQDGGKTYLVDRTGERWDISQAVSMGYDPRKFEFGIGRHAIKPLDDGDWHPKTGNNPPGMRVIGVAANGHAHAYSVKKLRSHETANTFLGAQAIVAGY